MNPTPSVAVFGAYGHTGRFVIAEMLARGWSPVLSGRDIAKLQAIATTFPGLEVRAASITDPGSLDRALDGVAAVINCAGPFAITQEAVIEAALRTQVSYLDIVAEPEFAARAFEHYGERARAAGIVIAPAQGFYGGLGDLIATAAIGDWDCADEIQLAYALSSWKPTLGTRATIRVAEERREGRRLVFAMGRLELRSDDGPVGSWTFPAPIGEQPVAEEFTTADSITIAQHLTVGEIRECMTLAPLADLSDTDMSPPPAIDERGRSHQTFLIEAIVRRHGEQRRAIVRGQDIYAVTGPIVVEAATRILANPALSGAIPAGAISNPHDFLLALSPQHLTLEMTA